MRNNKVIKFAAIALLSAFALTACNDDIIAKPTGYGDNSPVVTIKDENGNAVKVYNNKFDDIYDGIRSGSLPSDVLDTLLYQYSMSVFGNYNKVTAATVTNNQFGEVTLKQAVAGLTQTGGVYSGSQATKDFIKAHSAYWNKDKNGKRVKDDFKTELAEDADPEQAEYARLESKWNTIEKRIAQKLYSEINGGTYSEENVFYELKYLRSLSSSIENNVITISDAVKQQAFKGVLTSKVEDYDIFNENEPEKSKTEDLDGNLDFILHRNFYQSNYALNQEEAVDQDATYVEKHVIPDIYRQLLVEQYLLDESYDTLGRTSARHISILSISKNSNYATSAYDLMKTFVNETIFDSARTNDVTLDTLKIASNAWIGAFMSKTGYASTPEYALLSSALPADYLVAGTNPYFKGTSYGDMMEEYEKIKANPKISENESTYTSGNTYTAEVGKTIKTRELELKDFTSTGWYIKSVGVAALPESLKNQLFDINVANALDGKPCVEYTFDNEWKTNEDQANLINVVGKIKGQYFLRNTSRVKDVPVQSDILFESDGTYYIVLVEDAIRSINLSKSSYVDADAAKLEKLEGYINEIVRIVGNNDTYKNLSKKHWLEEMNLKYHDTEVYQYFKDNFPDLFD